MVLVNLEQLSTDELRNLSEQEQIDGFDEMSREELIQELPQTASIMNVKSQRTA